MCTELWITPGALWLLLLVCALGAALVADPRTPALHALRLALDWEGRFFSVEKPRARLSLGV